MSKSKSQHAQLVMFAQDFEKAYGEMADSRSMVQWGINNGRLEIPKEDHESYWVKRLGEALRSELYTDHNGNRVRMYASIPQDNGDAKQMRFWCDMRTASYDQREAGLQDRVKSSGLDVRRLCIDAHSYNRELRRQNEPLHNLRSQLNFMCVWDQAGEDDQNEGEVIA